MDISKASNFERFVFDLVGRDPAVIRKLWRQVETGGGFDLKTTPYFAALPEFAFVSGKSTHADRLATIRHAWKNYGLMIDPHTADGLKLALEHRAAHLPVLVLETAQPAKFEETIAEALNRPTERPPGLNNIESLPQHVELMDADIDQVKHFIAQKLESARPG